MGSRRIVVLGSTGSIGRQTLDVIDHLNALHEQGLCPCAYEIVGLAAATNANLLAQQCQAHNVTHTALADEHATLDAPSLDQRHVFRGKDAAEQLVRETEADLVVAAIVGIAGLGATLAAVERGTDVALANKETLVAAGSLVVPLATQTGARLLPIDSEHAAVWQCLLGQNATGSTIGDNTLCPPCRVSVIVARVILTASGGPFRDQSDADTYNATPDEALNHPTWNMGRKISIDSATLMNKALEVIEAHWLFALPASRIDVVIHPQSIVHSLVEFVDGSVVAQLGNPDMRLPIQTALTFPRRLTSQTSPLDFAAMSNLTFTPADGQSHRALALAQLAIDTGGSMGTVINAANESAVHAFLEKRIAFGQILEHIERTADRLGSHPIHTLDDVMQADAEARACVDSALTA
jgi:1-deoxy-D-xylulose-5-phosphate reductoisomerase